MAQNASGFNHLKELRNCLVPAKTTIPPRLHQLRAETNLNKPPPNWLKQDTRVATVTQNPREPFVVSNRMIPSLLADLVSNQIRRPRCCLSNEPNWAAKQQLIVFVPRRFVCRKSWFCWSIRYHRPCWELEAAIQNSLQQSTGQPCSSQDWQILSSWWLTWWGSDDGQCGKLN